MTSLVNPYFTKNSALEQTLFNRLRVESIKIVGRTYYYLPRNLQTADLILGEDVISKFSLAIPIEMYMENPTGFGGDREIFSKFGLQIQNQYKLTVAQSRWETEVKSQFDGSNTNGEAAFVKANYVRPHEGDLIYDPMTKFLMEITFVDHDEEYYQVGKNYTYSLTCEAFKYSSEDFSTGVTEIDSINLLSDDLLGEQLLSEDGFKLLNEYCDESIILESNTIVETDDYQYGDDFSHVESIIENPFE